MPPGFGADVTGKIGIPPGDAGFGALHDQLVQIAHVAFGQWGSLPGELTDIADGVVMIECLKMVF